MMAKQSVPFSSTLLIQQSLSAKQSFIDRHSALFDTLQPEQQNTFEQAVTLSDFVLRSALQAPERVITIFQQEVTYQPDYQADYLALLTQCLSTVETEEALHRALRLFRLESMVAIAVGDLVLDHPLTVSLERLSSLADALVLGALNWLSEFCYESWGVPMSAQGKKQPLLVYGMGKLGGRELNFSSDIDLIFAYPESGETVGARRSLDNHQFFTRLGQKLITALNSQTADGFVYRVDMRLRPFGESGPLVLSFSALEDYYQEQGRDWERYAMLKARLIGQGEYHKQLSTLLRPFVYRRYIDFSVFESLRKMKMMISQEVRRKQLRNNIKLGAGGIREIEFVVQVFQLIRGGRLKELQRRHLLSVLPLLVEHDIINEQSAKVLTEAYKHLRRVENVIQAINDEQTQTLPDDTLDQARLLAVLNISHWDDLLKVTQKHMDNVHKEFCALIGVENPNHQSVDEQWSTLWQSRWDDEEAIEYLTPIVAPLSANSVWQVLVEFRNETEKRRLGARGRQVLDKLMPLLFQHWLQAKQTEKVLERVLIVLTKVLTRTAYLELLLENEGALIHLIKLCYMSEWLADHIAKYPILLDELIDPKLLHNPLPLSAYSDELQQAMLRVPEDDVEMQMDTLRQFKQAQQLRIAAADIVEVLPIMKVSDHLTALAQTILCEVIQQAWRQVTARFGQPMSTVAAEHKGFAVIGYGKMGGIELGYSSDLDLVFLHESPPDDMTNGERSVPAGEFYLKLAQKIMHIFNTRMASGILYELDMRLRPSGNSGVLTIHVDAFDHYQKTEAWTWEHQALVRSRVIFGHDSLTTAFEQSRLSTLSMQRDNEKLKTDVIEMRNKMRDHLDKSTDECIDIKHSPGGLVDIEFMVQYLVLRHCHTHPKLCQYSDNIRIIETLIKYDILSDINGNVLINNYQQLRAFGHRKTLQNQSSLMAKEAFIALGKPVVAIWHQLFGE